MELYIVSRFFFFVFLVAQPILLSKFVADHEKEHGFYGLAAMFLIPLLYWAKTLYFKNLKYNLGCVWFLYSFMLVIMMGVIFGRAVIEDNKLPEQEIATCLCTANIINATTASRSFFDSKFLKITLCFTPGLMLLLLTSVTDKSGTLKQLYLTTVIDLFDGFEMIEILHEDTCNKIPMGWKIVVLVAAILLFFLSFLEVQQIEFDKDGEATERTTIAMVYLFFQIILNLSFLSIRVALWLEYDFDFAVFLAKNVLSLVITLVDVLEKCDFGIYIHHIYLTDAGNHI